MISFLFRFLILVLIRDYVRQDKLDFSFCFSVYQQSITKLDFRKHLFSKSVCFDSHYSTRFAGFFNQKLRLYALAFGMEALLCRNYTCK